MIEILAVFALQAEAEFPVVNISRECPEFARECVLAYGEWSEQSEALPIEHEPLTETQMVGPYERTDYIGLSTVIRARLEDGPVTTYIVRFQNSIDVYSPCGGLGHTSTFWPFLGYAQSGNPIVLAAEGELEIVSAEPDFNNTSELVIADAQTLQIVSRVPLISDWDTYLYDANGGVYLQARNGSCFAVPVDQRSRYVRRPNETCSELRDNGGFPESVGSSDPVHPDNLEFDFANSEYGWVYTYWLRVLRVPNLADRLILDIRNPCT